MSKFKKVLIAISAACGIALVLHAQNQTTNINGISNQYVGFSSGTSAAFGGSLLSVGVPITTTISVAGAVPGNACLASPSSGNAPLTGTVIDCYVSSAGTVTLRMLGLVVTTPSAQTYDVRVLP